MKFNFKKIFLLFLPLFFLLPSYTRAETTAGETFIDGAVLYQYEPAATDGTSFLKGPGVLNGIIYPMRATKIDKLYIFFHSVNPPCKDCHLTTPLEVCTEFKLCAKVASIPNLDQQTLRDTTNQTKNIAILIPQMNPQSGNSISADQFTREKFKDYLDEALKQLRSKISDTPNQVYVVASHGAGAGIAAKYIDIRGADEALIFDGCYNNDWCEKIIKSRANRKILYIGSKSPWTNLVNLALSISGAKIKETSAALYEVPEKCFLDHIKDSGCEKKTAAEEKNEQINQIIDEINKAKPTTEINFPGLNFSDVTAETDYTGTYIFIPWIAQFISVIYKFSIGIVSIIATIMIIVAGVRIIISRGGEQKTEGYKKITHALIGLIIAWGSFAILYNINPNMVEFKALKVKVIEPEELPPDNAKEDESNPEITKAIGNCSDPGFEIKDATTFDRNLNKAAYAVVKKLLTVTYPQMIPIYKQAEKETGIPWQMLAAAHYGEAGMRPNGSILNGAQPCNNNDMSDLYEKCPRCNTPNIQNDIICGGVLMQQKIKQYGQINAANPDIKLIKLAQCAWNGCAGHTSCPDATPYVAARFDQIHMGFPAKTAHDCVFAECVDNNGCIRDATLSPRPKNSCCKIRIPNVAPGAKPPPLAGGGSSCINNQPKTCCVNEGKTWLCSYTPTAYSKTNPCGTKIYKDKLETRPGVLVIYGIIKDLESKKAF